MRLLLKSTLLCFCVLVMLSTVVLHGQTTPQDDPVLTALMSHQYDLEGEGRRLLLTEAKENDFFLLGELHGDNEIPALLRALWPQMWKEGYRHVAAEISPWAANQLEAVPAGKGPEILGLWTKQEARDVHELVSSATNVLWGCDMEEIQPQFLIRELARLNPRDPTLKRMVELTKDGYNRKMAPDFLALASNSKAKRDAIVNDLSIRQNLLAALRIDKNRSSADTKMTAQNERELLMKQQLLVHLRLHPGSRTTSKVLLRFGRNHLHRGYDARGISTLGNFIAEFAAAHGQRAFNVGAFGAGGTATLMGDTFDADERQDELAFALLAQRARYSATLYDLRPLRELLHSIPQEKRSALQINLIYWADSYDALICYRNVTPLKP
jgi:hypothetical protein